MKKVAIYCPFYITDLNKGSWIQSWIDNVYKFEYDIDIFYSISYPDDLSKWDVLESNININRTLYTINSLDINLKGTKIFSDKNVEHTDALTRAYSYLYEHGYEYMIHIEQDVLLNRSISKSLVESCNNNDIVIYNTLSINETIQHDLDISVFCIKLKETTPNFHPMYFDTVNKFNILNLQKIEVDVNNIELDYKSMLFDIYHSNTIYDNYKKWIRENPLKDRSYNYITITPIFFDVVRYELLNAYRNKKMVILDNRDSFDHMANSRCVEHNNNITELNKTKICSMPFNSLYLNDTIYPCCRSWLNDSVESLFNTDDPETRWFKNMIPFKESIINGSYKYCTKCPNLKNIHDMYMFKNKNNINTDINKYPEEVVISYDASCNLQCKTCRKSIISNSIESIKKIEAKYIPFIAHARKLRISGDGDPFASKYYYDMLVNRIHSEFNNIEDICLNTNGILWDVEHWYAIPESTRTKIRSASISIDASTKETYKNVRGVDFDKLCKNLEFIKTLNISIMSSYTISILNYHDILSFIDFCDSYNINRIEFRLMDEWNRGMSTREIGITLDDPNLIEIIEQANKKILDKKHMVITLPTQKQIQNKHIETNMAKKNIYHVPVNAPELHLNNSHPIEKSAIYCPFYISNSNNGEWINKWIYSVGMIETLPKYYSIVYPSDIDISKYSDLITKLNSIATCIGIYENLYHSDILSIAHKYFMEHDYIYMVHMEQDVIITSPVANHIVNTLYDENNDYAITDISSNDYFLTDSDIDISIFAINVKQYNNDNYMMYVSSDSITDNLLIQSHSKFNCGECKIKPYLLSELSNEDIYKLQNNLTHSVYENSTDHWVHNYFKEADIHNLINPVYVDTGRTYPLHAYNKGKLTIIKGIQSYAKHLRQSRNVSTSQPSIITIDESIDLYGYSPYITSVIPYYSNGLDIVIISKNQKDNIEKMMHKLRLTIPTANRIFVLDRCDDGSAELLDKYNEYYIELNDRIGFCAGTVRNAGFKLTNPLNDVLFLDGDRIPNNLNIERINQMVYYFDISMMSHESDSRKWFSNVPTINKSYRRFNNDVWSSALLIRRTALNKISNIIGDNNIFDPVFDGNWGCEDEYLGDVAVHLNMTCGGFPNFIYVDGHTTSAITTSEEYIQQVNKRNNLKANLNTPIRNNGLSYMNKAERRNHIENFLKHRERLE